MITHLILLLGMVLLFFILGIGITPGKAIKNNFVLIPACGLAAVIGIAYILSANFKITGANAVSITIAILISSIVLRMRTIANGLTEAYRENIISKSLIITFIPILTLLLPAVLIGFKYFYGDVNFDFFFNSQDSWFLATHHVFQYAQSSSAQIVPLNWSADSQGRFGISLLAAFFYKWFNVNPLQFNSLLLNSIVVIFALTISGYCKEFYFSSFYKILTAVFFAVMSAAYTQSYAYYLLGQISAVPVFILYCIFLSRLFEKISLSQPKSLAKPWAEVLIIAFLLNILYFMYAILSFFALVLGGLSAIIYLRKRLNQKTLSLIVKAILLVIAVSCVLHAFTIPETLATLKGWLATSTKVTSGNKANLIVFPIYLKDSYFALLFGLLNYPSAASLFRVFAHFPRFQDGLLLVLGISVLITYCIVLMKYYKDVTISSAARVIVMVLSIILGLSFYFVIRISPYGIFKMQAWFMPLLLPLFIYGFTSNIKIPLRSLCSIALVLNFITATLYIYGFTISKSFVSVRGISGSKEINELADKLHILRPSSLALFLSNGIEEAWLVNSIRDIPIDQITHDYQPLYEKDLPSDPCTNLQTSTWAYGELLVLPRNNLIRSDITPAPIGGTVVYQNNNYTVLDPTSVQTLVYVGNGTYPPEGTNNNWSFFKKIPWIEKMIFKTNTDLPNKYRWVEKGAEIIIYSNTNKLVNFAIDVTPGNVTTQTPIRNIDIINGSSQHSFTFSTLSTLTIPNLQLHKGLTCLLIKSPDDVSTYTPKIGLIHKELPQDGRLLNFAISNIQVNNQ